MHSGVDACLWFHLTLLEVIEILLRLSDGVEGAFLHVILAKRMQICLRVRDCVRIVIIVHLAINIELEGLLINTLWCLILYRLVLCFQFSITNLLLNLPQLLEMIGFVVVSCRLPLRGLLGIDRFGDALAILPRRRIIRIVAFSIALEGIFDLL